MSREKATFIFASDLAPIRKFAPIMAADPAAIYGDLLPRLREADYRIVNLESPLDPGTGFIVKSGAAFTGSPEHIASLEAGGFDVAVMANNHTFDCGNAGFSATCELLKKHGIAAVGAGKNLSEARRPLFIEAEGSKIALFAISEGEDMRGATDDAPGVRPWEVDVLAEDIRRAKAAGAVVIVSAHCGLEYQPYPSFYVYEAFRTWARAGADIIVGHHPHVPQGMANFGGTPAYFSLGNFVFYQPVKFFYRKLGYMLEITVAGGRVAAHRPIPYRIGDDGLRLLAGNEAEEFEKLFDRLSAPLADADRAREAWHAVLACNGIAGFRAELENILDKLRTDPPRGAAMLRNRVRCMQHLTQWSDGMTRIADGMIDDAPAELVATVRDFLTREV